MYNDLSSVEKGEHSPIVFTYPIFLRGQKFSGALVLLITRSTHVKMTEYHIGKQSS